MNLLICIIAPGWADAPTRFDTMYMELLMGDGESERPQEDFEVEISDLDQVGATTGPSKAIALSSAAPIFAKPAQVATGRYHGNCSAGGLDHPGKHCSCARAGERRIERPDTYPAAGFSAWDRSLLHPGWPIVGAPLH